MLAPLMPPVAASPAPATTPPANPAPGSADAPDTPTFARLLGAAHAAKAAARAGPAARADHTAPGVPREDATTLADADAAATAAAGGGKDAALQAQATDTVADAAASTAASPDVTTPDTSTPVDAAALLATLGGVPQPQPPAPCPTAGLATRCADDAKLETGSDRRGRMPPSRAVAAATPRAADDPAAKSVAPGADPTAARTAAPGNETLAPAHTPHARGADSDTPQTWHQEWQAAASARAAEPAGASPDATPAIGAMPASGSPTVGATSAPAAPADAAPLSSTLSAHAQSAAFGPELGAHITTFVRAGVEHARLELHPAEMGPVSVRIELDGNTAQVHLGAEHAATRQVLEQAMPLLAGSLREAGLTLTGGGVFEQPRQSQPGTPEASTSAARGAREQDGALQPALPTPALRQRGVIDLVA